MRRAGFVLLVTAVFATAGVSVGDDPKPAAKESTKARGFLPLNWKDLGLTDEQKQQIYTIQNKYNEDIDKLEYQIKELKGKIAKERLEVLTPDQKKKLEEIYKSKAGGGK